MKRLGALLVLLGSVFLLGSALADRGGSSLPTKERIEGDLRLLVELKGPKVVQAGAHPWVTLTLVNNSKTATHRVVRPGDGSAVGWREPYIYWTATIDRGDGKPVPVPRADYGRCGLFDHQWPKDAILLKPADRLPVEDWLPGPLLEFQQPGRARLRAHYAYNGGDGPRSRSRVQPGQRGQMTGVPTFELISDPVEFDVVRPLDVRVKVKKALKVHDKTRLSDLLEVVLVNQSPEPVECSSPTLYGEGARLVFQIDGEYGGWRPTLSEERSHYNAGKRMAKPGEAIPLLGQGEFANGMDGTWEYPKEGNVRLRAVYATTIGEQRASILSDWVEVRVRSDVMLDVVQGAAVNAGKVKKPPINADEKRRE